METKSIELSAYAPVAEPPLHSAIEDDGDMQTVNFRTFIEVLAIVCWTRLRLRRQKIKLILDELTDRQCQAMRHYSEVSGSRQHNLISAAREFIHARRYVPVKDSCLLDSLSMIRFLARRQLPAKLVFGVTLEPFSAHCWVQTGDVTLNETVSDANTYTPILVV